MIVCAKLRWKEVSAFLTLTAAFLLCLWGGQADQVSAASADLPPSVQPADYLSQLGWEVSGEPTVDQVRLPESFGAEYEEYLAIQVQAGFDLAAHAGETVTRYSYPLSKYPTGEEGILADLLVLDGEIVGGELRSPRLDGFMRALVSREKLL